MNLQDFRDYIAKFPSGHNFEYGISEPFSWRGIYAEVAFSIIDGNMCRYDILKRIDMCLDRTFIGYNGVEYKYDWTTPVNFEDGYNEYTDGAYVDNWIFEIQGKTAYMSKEEELVRLAFTQ